VALIDDKFNGQICSTAFCVLRAKGEKIIPFFIYHTVSRESFIAELGKIQRGASYPAVTDTDVKNQKIPLPSLNEQKKISDILSAIDNKIEAEENKKQTLESLFKTLLSLLMTGKIRVKDLDI
jgi:type I restriction enzyme S subunit